MTSVSMNTPKDCTSPCLAGWETSAVAAAFGALPMPASSDFFFALPTYPYVSPRLEKKIGTLIT
jgi:hypothetical protein